VVALRRLYYDTVNETPAALRCTCETVGARQVLLGTDYPYLLGDKFKRCVTYVQESGLPPSDVEAILERNAETLLGLTASAPGR
jgi:aminocarboxymuconate-semialdehyde decarboxylase